MILAGFMLGTFVISFALQSLLAKFFGASATLDAYTVGNSISFLFINWIAYGAVSIILIPVFTEYRHSGEEKTIDAANTFVSVLLIISLVVTTLCIVAAPQIISILGRGFDAPTQSLAVNLCRLIMPIFPVMVVCGILSGLLRAYERYNVTPMARCFELLPVIAALFLLGKSLGIYAVPAGMLAGALLSLAIHLYFSPGTGLRFRLRMKIRQDVVRTMLATFLLFGVISTSKHVVFLVDRVVASYLEPGSVALYHFASRFQMLIVMILPMAVSIPFYTRLNQHLHAKDEEKVRSTIHHGLRLISVAIIPLVTLLVLFRIPIIELWLQHGAFSQADTLMVSSLFLFLVPSFLIEAFAPISFHIYFSMKDIKVLKVLVVIVLIEVGLNIILDFLLVQYLGLRGIALATSIAKFPMTVVGWLYIGHYMGGLRLRALTPYLLRIVAASSCMALLVFGMDVFLLGFIGTDLLGYGLRLGILFLAGTVIYVLLCVLFRIREVTEMGGALYNKVSGLLRSA